MIDGGSEAFGWEGRPRVSVDQKLFRQKFGSCLSRTSSASSLGQNPLLSPIVSPLPEVTLELPSLESHLSESEFRRVSLLSMSCGQT